jgi:hypothetical protein
MVNDEWDDDDLPASRFSLRSVLIRNWPYFIMLVLGVFGVALTSFARPAITTFWLRRQRSFAVASAVFKS